MESNVARIWRCRLMVGNKRKFLSADGRQEYGDVGSIYQGMSEYVSINKFFDEAMVVELAQHATDLHQQMI
nr:110 kDa U5 small nuclear ribonucleoprotein component CLO [Tanacetum cinerariifolium]